MEKIVLPNGIRVLVESCDWFRSTAMVLGIEGGLGDESEANLGVTHLLEHLLFKRTGKRDTMQIASFMDELGGDVNAFTDVTSVCLHGTVPTGRTTELLSFFAELLRDAKFGDAELVLEKEIIRQELLEASDNPADIVYQNLCECLWPESIYRYPVFGTFRSIEKLSTRDVRQRLAALLNGKRIFIAASGNLRPAAFAQEVEKLFGDLPAVEWDRPQLPEMKCGSRLISHPVHQVHLALAQQAPSVRDKDYLEAMVFSNIFGEGMSSRLFQLLREEKGLAYDVSTHIESVANVGLLVTSAVLEREAIHEALDLILSEMHKVRDNSVTLAELERVKRFISAQLEMELDSVSARLWRMVETELQLGRFVSAEEVLTKIEGMTLPDLNRFIEQRVLFSGNALVLGGDVGGLELRDEVRKFCDVIL
ncbi:MAG: pitrilysin family protein [Bdellovibrionota bacterium]